jgi:O-methyltransferase involved in polyketide biosynthesis
VVTVDALKPSGPDSLESLAASLDPQQGLAIITEGLMSYLDPESAQGLWRRIAQVLRKFPHGVYLSDMYVRTDRYGLGMRVFRGFVQRRVRGRMHVHFQAVEEAQQTLMRLGFGFVELHEPRDIEATRALGNTPGGDRVRILEARP